MYVHTRMRGGGEKMKQQQRQEIVLERLDGDIANTTCAKWRTGWDEVLNIFLKW